MRSYGKSTVVRDLIRPIANLFADTKLDACRADHAARRARRHDEDIIFAA